LTLRTVTKPCRQTRNRLDGPIRPRAADDCQAVPDKAIGEGPRGYIIRATGEVIGYADTRIKHSPDGMTHWCAGIKTKRTICLFIPPKGF
jgi:hypothetical protein